MAKNKKSLSPEQQELEDIRKSEKINLALAAFLPGVVGAAFGGEHAAKGFQQSSGFLAQIAKEQSANIARLQEAEARSEELQFREQAAQARAMESREFQAQEAEKSRKFQAEESEKTREFQIEKAREAREFKEGKVKDPKQLSEMRAKARKFADTAELSEVLYQKALKETGFSPTGISATLQTIGQFALPKELEPIAQTEGFERVDAAESEFINATLRDDSGAAIKDEEEVAARARLFPRPGESDATVEQKKKTRELILLALKEKGSLLTVSEARSLIGEKIAEGAKPTQTGKVKRTPQEISRHNILKAKKKAQELRRGRR